MVDQRRQIGRIGYAVGFAMHEGAGLSGQLRILFRLAAGEGLGCERHGLILSNYP